MNETYTRRQPSAWKTLTLASFVVASAMMAGGIGSRDAGFAAKGFYAMARLMLVHTAIPVTKMPRAEEESSRIHNRLEAVRTERLLMGAEWRPD